MSISHTITQFFPESSLLWLTFTTNVCSYLDMGKVCKQLDWILSMLTNTSVLKRQSDAGISDLDKLDQNDHSWMISKQSSSFTLMIGIPVMWLCGTAGLLPRTMFLFSERAFLTPLRLCCKWILGTGVEEWWRWRTVESHNKSSTSKSVEKSSL